MNLVRCYLPLALTLANSSYVLSYCTLATSSRGFHHGCTQAHLFGPCLIVFYYSN
jgi:hypothetical protein